MSNSSNNDSAPRTKLQVVISFETWRAIQLFRADKPGVTIGQVIAEAISEYIARRSHEVNHA